MLLLSSAWPSGSADARTRAREGSRVTNISAGIVPAAVITADAAIEKMPASETGISVASDQPMPTEAPLTGNRKFAISTQWPTGGDPAAARFLYQVSSSNYLDVGLGLSIGKRAQPSSVVGMASATSTNDSPLVGFLLSLGYRMYQPVSDRVHPYLAPYLQVATVDLPEIPDNISIRAGGLLGVDFSIFDQFTLGAQLGAGLVTQNLFNTWSIGLYTSAVNATFWW